MAMWEVTIVRLGEVGSPREGTWVGEPRLKRLEFVRESMIKVSLASASVHAV